MTLVEHLRLLNSMEIYDYMILKSIINSVKKDYQKNKWHKRNINNSTIPINGFNYDSVTVGDFTYGELMVLDFSKSFKLFIGSFCSIASGVVFCLAGDHQIETISTFPFKAKALNGKLNEALSKGNIVIDDDVWIGQNSIILSGVHIGQGAVVAAGAVVTKDVPPYTVVAGVPAKIIKHRFNKEVIEYMLSLDYSQLTKELIGSHIDDLYKPLNEMSIDEIKSLFSWFPKEKNL